MYDVIVIGGGCIGTSIIRTLSKYNIKSALFEKNSEICQETTKANSAIVHGGYDARVGTLKAKLNVQGASMYGDLSEELDFTYRQIGSLVLAFNSQEEETLKELYARGLENKVVGLEIISGDRARELEPFISPDVTQALYCRSAGVVDPFNYSYAMMENALENGAELFTNRELIAIEKKEDHIVARTNQGDFSCKYLINAAGIFSDRVANMAGDYDFKIIPTKGVYRLLAKDKYREINKVLFQTPSQLGKGVLVTSTYAGNTMIGPSSERLDAEHSLSEEESLDLIDELSKKSVPSLDLNKTIRVFTGIRAKPDTRDFMIYPSKNMDGLVHVGGIESPGLSAAPAIGLYVEEILKSIGFEAELREDYQPRRTRIARIEDLDRLEREERIRDNPQCENIICRCERVTEAEIVEAIKRPGGAKSRDGVKRRVRAGMGFCQGNYCGPKVREIIARELDMDIEDLPEELKGSEMVEKLLREKK